MLIEETEMNYKTIIDRLYKAGFYEFKKGFDGTGPKIGVRVGDGCLWAYPPIDDDFDVEFADSLIEDAKKLEKEQGPRRTAEPLSVGLLNIK